MALLPKYLSLYLEALSRRLPQAGGKYNSFSPLPKYIYRPTQTNHPTRHNNPCPPVKLTSHGHQPPLSPKTKSQPFLQVGFLLSAHQNVPYNQLAHQKNKYHTSSNPTLRVINNVSSEQIARLIIVEILKTHQHYKLS